MRTTMGRRKTHLPEEEAYRRINEVVDLELLALELEYNEEIGSMIRESVKKKLDGNQRAFDAMLAVHPATLAENARRAEARLLETERLERIVAWRKECEERSRCAAVGRLARRWGARLVRRAG